MTHAAAAEVRAARLNPRTIAQPRRKPQDPLDALELVQPSLHDRHVAAARDPGRPARAVE